MLAGRKIEIADILEHLITVISKNIVASTSENKKDQQFRKFELLACRTFLSLALRTITNAGNTENNNCWHFGEN